MSLRRWGDVIPAVLIACTIGIWPLCSVHAQRLGERHEHEPFEFSHPLVTESPSPDTKIRIDFLTRAAADSTTPNGTVRVEGEYAFRPWVSLALTIPYQWRNTAGSQSSHFSASELAIKFAHLGLASHGILLGGGLDMGLPTGAGVEELGSAHSVELEPFADVAMKTGSVEVVAFGTYSASTGGNAGEAAEREWSANFSSLYHASGRAEALLEFDTHRPLSGPDQGSQFANVSPGVKLVPFSNRSIMFGASLRLPFSTAREFQREVLVTAMYHF